MQIISISGLDGSGKSTQIEMLRQHLESQGKKVFYFHAVQFSVANSYNLKAKSQKLKAGNAVTSASWLQIQLRKLALFIDIIRFKKLTKKLENKHIDYVLSDRYFYDNLINIAYLEAKSQKLKAKSCIPKPDFAFYLDADPQAIMQRDRAPEQGMKYLQKKKELLDAFFQEQNLTVIDGNKSKEEIFTEIKTRINS